MSKSRFELRGVGAAHDGAWEVQLLEIDIAVRAEKKEEIAAALRHAIELQFDIAVEHHQKPFQNLKPAPSKFQKRWTAGERTTKSSPLGLRAEVALALTKHLSGMQPTARVGIISRHAARLAKLVRRVDDATRFKFAQLA